MTPELVISLDSILPHTANSRHGMTEINEKSIMKKDL